LGRSVGTIWIVMTPLSALGLLCVLVARKYTLKRNVVKAGEESAESAESATVDEKHATTPEGAHEIEDVAEVKNAETHDVPAKEDEI
jgi:hypothetical protein